MLASVQGSQKSATACVPLVISEMHVSPLEISEMHVSPTRSPRCGGIYGFSMGSVVKQYLSPIGSSHAGLRVTYLFFRGATLQDFPLSPSQRPFSPCIKLALPIEVPVFPNHCDAGPGACAGDVGASLIHNSPHLRTRSKSHFSTDQS